MALSVEKIYAGLLGNAMADLYPSPVGQKTLVTTLHIHNTGAGVNTVTIAHRNAGAGADYIIYKKAFAPDESKIVSLWEVLAPTDVLRGVATTAAEVSVVAGGVIIV